MTEQTFLSVWDAMEDSPEMAENMKIRSALMIRASGSRAFKRAGAGGGSRAFDSDAAPAG
jgi:hypothetical protein